MRAAVGYAVSRGTKDISLTDGIVSNMFRINFMESTVAMRAAILVTIEYRYLLCVYRHDIWGLSFLVFVIIPLLCGVCEPRNA